MPFSPDWMGRLTTLESLELGLENTTELQVLTGLASLQNLSVIYCHHFCSVTSPLVISNSAALTRLRLSCNYELSPYSPVRTQTFIMSACTYPALSVGGISSAQILSDSCKPALSFIAVDEYKGH